MFFSQWLNAKLDNIKDNIYLEVLVIFSITHQEIITAISKFRYDKTSESDRIPKIVLKYIRELITLYLDYTFNSSLHLDYYLRNFQNVPIIVLYKPKRQEKKTSFILNLVGQLLYLTL